MTAYFILSIAIGVLASIHLAMNGKIATLLASTAAANCLFWTIGALTAGGIWLFGGERHVWERALQVPLYLWLAGAFGASIVLGISFLMPRFGVAQTTVGLMLGQLATGAVISHFGWFNSPIAVLDIYRVVGLLFVLGGTLLVVR